MNKTAVVIGGTFNPITRAHVEIGVQAGKRYPHADIIYIPSNLDFISRWKDVSRDDVFGDRYRLRLIRDAIAPYGFLMNTMEAQGLTNGTTYESVRYLKNAGYEEVVWCIGYDKLGEVEQWYQAQMLLRSVKFLVFSRENRQRSIRGMGKLETDFDVVDLDGEFQEISSTKVRSAYWDKDFDTMKRMTPTVVYEFLREKRMSQFDAKKVKEACVDWIRDWFEKNGSGCNCVCGISGGKDSSVVAALCAEALGRDRVIGVLMPQNEQSDIDCSYLLVSHLGIRSITVNIGDTVNAVLNSIKRGSHNSITRDGSPVEISGQAGTNLPARIRMATLYAISQSNNGRVANTCNLSEDWVGYSTVFGDAAGDFSPLSDLTVTEVKQIGYELGLPVELIEKVPIDGLSGKTDEDNLGFSYAVLDRYIRTGECGDAEIKAKIDRLHERNKFKLEPMPKFSYPV